MEKSNMNNKYKILMRGNFGKSHNQICDENHIRDAFRELGHEVFENDESQIANIDLILTFKSNSIGPETIREWKLKTNAPIWIWTFDNMDRFPWFYDIAKECDLWLGEELERVDRFKQQSIPFYYFPNHAVPQKYFYKVDKPKIYDAVFTGTPYDEQYDPDKFELLKAIQEKFDLHIFGNDGHGWINRGFKNVHPPAFDDCLSKVYGQSKIVIGISNCQCEGYWSIRSSQALMCGAFMLVRFTPQMEKELKDNVVYFNSIPDCLEKIDYYLKNESEREMIAQQGYEYAQKYLTNKQRCKELIILFENFKKYV